MNSRSKRIKIENVKAYPLSERASRADVHSVMKIPNSAPSISAQQAGLVSITADSLKRARENNASRIFIYGAHLIKNGANPILIKLIEEGWITHLATNGAGVIHDWEFAYLGRSTECVKTNVSKGMFGTWEETGKVINLCAHLSGVENIGFGESLGHFVCHDGMTLPNSETLKKEIIANLSDSTNGAKSDLINVLEKNDQLAGQWDLPHPHKDTCVVGQAWKHNVPLTIHPGIGYDIYAAHPMFHGAAVGRAAGIDFEKFCNAVDGLDSGVTLSIGSAIMGPQVFEKSVSVANNFRLNQGEQIISDHDIFVVDIQDGGNWDWTQGEPPIDNPAYYLRFCKSYSRMGGNMRYLCMDNISFIYHLARELQVLP